MRHDGEVFVHVARLVHGGVDGRRYEVGLIQKHLEVQSLHLQVKIVPVRHQIEVRLTLWAAIFQIRQIELLLKAQFLSLLQLMYIVGIIFNSVRNNRKLFV